MANDQPTQPAAITQDPQVAINLDPAYAPGSPLFFHVVPIFKKGNAVPDAAVNDRSLRHFTVTGLLLKKSAIGHTGRVDGDFGPEDGECYLKLNPCAIAQHFDTTEGTFLGKPTKAGELGLIEFECDANTAYEAKQKFLAATGLGLDHLSYIYNVPIAVTTVRVFDQTHQSTYVAFSAPYKLSVIENSDAILFTEMKSIYAMYREAKNATSEFYRFFLLIQNYGRASWQKVRASRKAVKTNKGRYR